MLVVAVDPGGTTGYAVFEIQDNKSKFRFAGQAPSFSYIREVESEILNYQGPISVVVERYIIVAVSTNAYMPLEVIGATKYWITNLQRKGKDVRLVEQMPGDRIFVDKRFRTPYPKIKSHARSALQHAICFIYKSFGITEYD